jgi:filamentous hemagglutinin family protein
MNHVYRTLWNRSLAAWVAVAETAAGAGKGSTRKARRAGPASGPLGARPLLSVLAAACAAYTAYAALGAPSAHAGPSGAQVSAGSGSVAQAGAPGATTTTVTQTSPRLAINWQSFNTAAGETVNFVQPGSSAVALNRVLGSDGTQFLGSLNANGQVFVINPNGVLFGKTAQVNVGGLVASTLSLGDADFMAGKLRFSSTGNAASVVNQGSLAAADGGYVALLGGQVSNSGTITAKLGSVALAAGQAVTLDFAGDGLLNVAVDQGALNALAANSGSIVADGGSALLTARAAGDLIGTVVNNTGLIQARTLQNKAGVIRLLGGMDAASGGTVQVAGTLDASAPNGGDGGYIDTSARTVNAADGTQVTTAAAQGKTGTWLIDPADYTIAASGGNISGATLSSNLGTTNQTIVSSSGSSTASSSGSINVNDTVSWGANTLTLTAAKDVNINAVMNASGSAGLALNPATANGNDAAVAGGTVNVAMSGAKVNFSGNSTLMINGSGYTILNSASQLSSMNSSLAGKFALGADLDASSLSGFAPIGSGGSFSGVFDGLGHTVGNLTINLPDGDFVGLFGRNAGTIRNVGVVGGAVTGYGPVGGLVGRNDGTISNAYSTTAVSGLLSVGGLVGQNGNYTQGNAPIATLTNVYATGSVSNRSPGSGQTGGLVGANYGDIRNAYATGTVNGGQTGKQIGGLIGSAAGSFTSEGIFYYGGSVSNVYSLGAVTGAGYLGGLIGFNSGTTITNGFWNTQTSGQSTSAGGTGLSTAQLQAALPTGFSSSTWGNAGNQSTPYQLSNPGPVMIGTDSSTALYQMVLNAAQLQNINSGLTKNYALGNSIDLSSIANFNPLGNDGKFYSGTFDGLNFTLSNLKISRGSMDYVGLFGFSAGTIRNLGLVGGSVIGGTFVGGLVGYNLGGAISNANATSAVSGTNVVGGLVGFSDGMIGSVYATGSVSGGLYLGGLIGANKGSVSAAYATGAVSGTGYLGGLVGNNSFGTISNAYATGSVSGSSLIGGLVGINSSGTISNAYATGAVSGLGILGGLTGYNPGTISNAYWNTQTTGQSTSAGGTGLTTAQLQAALPTGFASSVWGNANNQSTPYLLSNPGPVMISTDSSNAPYQIVLNATQLQNINSGLGKNYALGNSIDLGGIANFNPLGTGITPYAGTFDGLNFTLSNISINRGTTNYVGLFGVNGGTIRNVAMADGSVTGGAYVGSLVGINNGTIGNVNASTAVSGYSHVGGLAGDNNGSIGNAYATGAVSASGDYLGGLVGASYGTINNAYATGAATGKGYVGGLVGYQSSTSTISNASASGAVTGSGDYIGGLVGASFGKIDSAYATGTVTGHNDVGGLVGYSDGSSTISNTYAMGAASGNSTVGGLVGASFGKIDTAYATGSVTGSSFAGGLVGYNNGGAPISNAYWNTQTTGQSGSSGGGTGLTTAQLEAALPGGFSSSVWGNAGNQSTPYLLNNAGPVMISTDSSNALYQIVLNATQLQNINNALGKNYALGNSIDLSSIANFNPLGNNGSYFSGTFDGLNFTLSNLTINRSSMEAVGLFGYNLGTIRNIGVIGGSVTGYSNVGGLAGLNIGIISNSYTTSAASGLAQVGGLVGININGGIISNAYATGAVSAATEYGYAGGLVGVNYSGTIRNAYATGEVSRGSTVGGLVGFNLEGGVIINAYATGKVSGNSNVGGLVGLNAGSTISNSFWDVQTTRQSTSAGGTGLTTAQMQQAGSFTGWSLSNAGGDGTVWRIYEGSTAPLLRSFLTALDLGSSSAVYNGATQTLALPAGTDTSLVLGSAASGIDAGAYTSRLYSTQQGYDLSRGQLTITPKTVTATATAQDKVYDASTAATATASADGLYARDGITVAYTTATFADKNVGSGKPVTVNGISLSGTGMGNYTLANTTATTTAAISPASISAVSGITANGKTYDATTAATLNTDGASYSGKRGNDVLTVATATGAFIDKNAGNGKTVNISGITLGGADAGNYTLANSTATATADISKASISAVTDITANGKIYDATTAATLNTGGAGYSGKFGNDVLTVATATGAFSDKNAGNGKTVNITGITLGGADAGNYTLGNTTATATADIAPKTVTVSGITANNKVYDATTAATLVIANASATGLIPNDAVSFNGANVTGTFADKNVGTGKSVVLSGTALSGASAGNYTLIPPSAITADISPASISAVTGITANSKTYDATTAATLNTSGASYNGKFGNDVLTVATATGAFSDKNAATGKTVNISGITLGGADAGNYTLAKTTATAKADITPKTLTVSGITANSKPYDATTTATFNTSGAALSGLIIGDTVTVGIVTGDFASATLGYGKAVTVNAVGLNGSDAGNYRALQMPTGLTANITTSALCLRNRLQCTGL